MGLGLLCEWKSKVPQRPHLFHVSVDEYRSSGGGTTTRSSFSSLYTYSETSPVTEISGPFAMSSSTSTMPPEARPPSDG